MSKSLTVRLTVRRSSARSAPISYTPPVNPPPPRTSAVFERRLPLRVLLRVLLSLWLGPALGVGSSSTTSPIRPGKLTGGPPGPRATVPKPPRAGVGLRGKAVGFGKWSLGGGGLRRKREHTDDPYRGKRVLPPVVRPGPAGV